MKANTKKSIRIKLKDIRSNPFRDLSIYPINEEKVLALIESIKDTGYWDSIIGRKTAEGNVEICFGHHRLEALKKVYGNEYEIIVSVQPLSDSEMLKRMSKENDEAYNCPIMAIDDSVNSTISYLDSHPDEARAFLTSVSPEAKRLRIGAPIIAKYLGMRIDKVQKSIERLNLIKDEKIDKEALYEFPSAASADNFARAVIQFDIKKSEQKHIAEQIKAEKRYGGKSIVDSVMKYRPNNEMKKQDVSDSNYCELTLRNAIKLISKLRHELNDFCIGFGTVTFTGGQTTPEDISENTRNAYNNSMNELAKMVKEVAIKIDAKRSRLKNK